MGLTDVLARVDLGAIVRNAARLRRRAQNRPLLVAVKANAYGHGAVHVARALEGSGVAAWFGVATAAEALQLRAAGIAGRILVLGPVPGSAEDIRPLVAQGIDMTVAGFRDVTQVAEAVALEKERCAGLPLGHGTRPPQAKVHLKTDTGMGRMGYTWRQAAQLAPQLAGDDAFDFVGVWTHLVMADDTAQDAFTRCQLDAFDLLLADLERQGCRPPIAHAANSAGLVRFPQSHYDMVRAGIGVYGHMPSVEGRARAAEAGLVLEPAMQLAAPVTFVKQVPAGTPISYGATWTATRPTWMVTVRAGYADGYPRALSNKGRLVVGGRPASVAGRVCMDQMVLALDEPEDGPPAIGDEAILFGSGAEGDTPAADVLGAACGTHVYDLLVRVSARVPRAYHDFKSDDAQPVL